MTDKKQKIFFAAKGTFYEMCRDILMQIGDEGTVLKITVFNAPADNHEYMGNLSLLRQLVAEKFGCNAPLTAYVAQPCVTAGLAAEVTYMPSLL